MNSKKREVGQVSFSLLDNYEKSLWKHASKQGAFSKYVKRLIAQDKDKQVSPIHDLGTPIINIKEDKEAAKAFL